MHSVIYFKSFYTLRFNTLSAAENMQFHYVRLRFMRKMVITGFSSWCWLVCGHL